MCRDYCKCLVLIHFPPDDLYLKEWRVSCPYVFLPAKAIKLKNWSSSMDPGSIFPIQRTARLASCITSVNTYLMPVCPWFLKVFAKRK